MRRPQADLRTLAIAAVLLFEDRRRGAASASRATMNWSSTGVAVWPLRLMLSGVHHAASVMAVGPDGYLVLLGKEKVEVSIVERSERSLRFTAFGLQQTARFALQDGVLHLDLHGTTVTVRETALEAAGSGRRDGSSRLVAPMNGAIVGLLARAGDRVIRGQRVVVLEAMKMQHEISAERDGTIEKILVKPGEQVAARQLLAVLVPESVAGKDEMEESA